MSITKKCLFVIALVAIFGATMGSAQAGEERWPTTAIRQLGRGLANVGFGFLEIPASILDVKDEDGEIAGLTYGPLRGVFRCCVREVVGVLEVATFPLAFEPIVEPEFPVILLLSDGMSDSERLVPEWNVNLGDPLGIVSGLKWFAYNPSCKQNRERMATGGN